jgi:hypothetical protein
MANIEILHGSRHHHHRQNSEPGGLLGKIINKRELNIVTVRNKRSFAAFF